MTTDQLIETIRNLGGTLSVRDARLEVTVPKGRMTPQLRDALTELKPALIETLGARDVSRAIDQSMHKLERMNLALRIESAEYGTVWLISRESNKTLIDTNDPVYTAREARFVVEMTPQEFRLLHGFKRHFGATIECKRNDPEGQVPSR